MRSVVPTDLPCYCLRGRMGEIDYSFFLEFGFNRIGRAADNTIVLPIAGVSLHHARTELGPDGLWLEDLGSRSGTTVAGCRIVHCAVGLGEEIGLGPVALRVEEIDVGDTRLGLSLDAEAETIKALRKLDANTGMIEENGSEPTGSWDLPSLERVLDRVAVAGCGLWREGDGPIFQETVLEAVVQEFNGEGAIFLEWHQTKGVVVLATYGEIEACMADPGLRDLLAKITEQSPPICWSTSVGAPPWGVCAMAKWQGKAPLGLVLETEALSTATLHTTLRVILRLLYILQPRDMSKPEKRDAELTELAFPKTWAVCRSPPMRHLYEELRSVVACDLSVLIEGETGVGKELVAQIIHRSSPRRDGPFVAVNCAAIPAELYEAEMFGIGDGVATGVRGRLGHFQEAHGGTLFLDEIGDMPTALQAKLLRALQEKRFRPVGQPATTVDIRVIAATNCDLLKYVEDGRFRSDLYYRVAGLVVRVPPPTLSGSILV